MNNMTRSQKTISAPSNEAIITIDDHVRGSDIFKQSEGSRTFEYKLDDKAAKAKLIKAAKRASPFMVEVSSTSCNLVFNAGAWHTVALPSIGYWNEVKDDQTCKINEYTV